MTPTRNWESVCKESYKLGAYAKEVGIKKIKNKKERIRKKTYSIKNSLVWDYVLSLNV